MSKDKLYYVTKDIEYMDSYGNMKVIKSGFKFAFSRDLGSKVILSRWNKPFIVDKSNVREAEVV